MLARIVMAAAIASLVLLFGAPEDALACHRGDPRVPHGNQTFCDGGGGDTLGFLDCADGDIARLDPEGSGEWQCLSLRELKLALSAIINTVFVTSDGYSGDLVSEATALGFGGGTGLEAGDFICNVHAQSASLDGSYIAWLSDSTTEVKDRLTPFSGPFLLLNGTSVAADTADLLDTTLEQPINIDEWGSLLPPVFEAVWTGSLASGNITPSVFNCIDWTSSLDENVGMAGDFNSPSNNWTDGFDNSTCNNSFGLYCFSK